MKTGRLAALGSTARIGVVAVVGLAASGCGAREFLDSGRHNGELFLGTFLALAITTFLIALLGRRRQLERWDLRAEPTAPLALAAVHPLFWIGGVAAFLLFLVVDLTLVQHGGQRALNLLLWTAAAVIGGFVGGFLGVRLAERRWR